LIDVAPAGYAALVVRERPSSIPCPLEVETVRTALRAASTAALFAALATGAAARSGDEPSAHPEDLLAPFARYIGEWEVDAKWSDGTPLHARATYAWGINKKIIIAKTFVRDPQKGEYQRYEGVMAWHPKKKSLFEVSFAYNGEVSEVLIDVADKDTLHVGYRPYEEGQPANVRQVLRLTDPDTMVWTVSLKSGDKWDQIIEAAWHRKAR
jgi:hypothetical protein